MLVIVNIPLKAALASLPNFTGFAAENSFINLGKPASLKITHLNWLAFVAADMKSNESFVVLSAVSSATATTGAVQGEGRTPHCSRPVRSLWPG